MSNKDDMRALQAFIALKKKADAGDSKAQMDIAKITANPKAMMRLKQLASSIKQAAQLSEMLTTTAPTLLGVHESTPEDIYDGDDFELSEQIYKQLPPGSDSLDHKALFRKAKWSGLDRVAPFTRTNPPSVLQGTLGGYQIVVAGGPVIQVCNWSGDDSETTPVGITLAPIEQLVAGAPDGLESTVSRPFAIVQFGTRGMSVLAEVDIGTGCQMVVGGSSVLVQVGMDAAPAGLAAGSMKLAGMLSFHPTVRTTPITRTRYIDVQPGVFTQEVSIPPFAKKVSVYALNTDGVMMTVIVEDINKLAIYKETSILPEQVTDVELSSDAVFVKVSVTGTGVGYLSARVIFDLSF